MSYLDQFNLTLDKGVKFRPFVTIAPYGVNVSKDLVRCFPGESYAHIYFDDEKKVVVVRPCKEDEHSYKLFSKNDENVRWASKELREHMLRLAGVSKDGKYYLEGDYIDEDNAIVFDLNNIEEKI